MTSPSDTIRSLVILGDGTFAVETLDVAEAAGLWRPVGFVNSLEPQPADRRHAGLPVFGLDELPYGPEDAMLVAGLVSTARRALIETMTVKQYRFATLVHPSAVVSPRAELGAGAVIGAQVVVGSQARVGEHVIVNRGALIGHDVVVGPYSTVGPGANIAGGVSIGTAAFVGVGAVVRDHLSIGDGAVIAAGAVVVGEIEPHVLVAGVPAVVIRHGVDGL